MTPSTRARFVGSISWLALACSVDDGTTQGNVDKDAATTRGAGGTGYIDDIALDSQKIGCN